MSARGGGDGPEAVTAGLYEALNMPWRPNATKVCVLIADAPPHGLEPHGDGFPNGDPDGRDPLEIAREMVVHNITVYTVGCELSSGTVKQPKHKVFWAGYPADVLAPKLHPIARSAGEQAFLRRCP